MQLYSFSFNRWYSLRSYYLAITISDIPFQAIFCFIYVSIVYYFTSQPLELFRYGMFLTACLLISFVAQSVGLVVGAAMNVQNGVFLAPVMSVPFLLFSGFFVSFNAIPFYLRWVPEEIIKFYAHANVIRLFFQMDYILLVHSLWFRGDSTRNLRIRSCEASMFHHILSLQITDYHIGRIRHDRVEHWTRYHRFDCDFRHLAYCCISLLEMEIEDATIKSWQHEQKIYVVSV